jgi:hypothetical protein
VLLRSAAFEYNCRSFGVGKLVEPGHFEEVKVVTRFLLGRARGGIITSGPTEFPCSSSTMLEVLLSLKEGSEKHRLSRAESRTWSSYSVYQYRS